MILGIERHSRRSSSLTFGAPCRRVEGGCGVIHAALNDAQKYQPSRGSQGTVAKDTIAAAERANDPGRFTAFIGYEWSSHGIHRNVVYGGDAAPDYPFSALDSQRAQDLWLALEAQRAAGQPVKRGHGLVPVIGHRQKIIRAKS